MLSSFPALARKVPITILHTTDLHGHVLPARDYDGTEGVGGLLRCATAITEIKARVPNVLLVDCGDLYQGGRESHATQGAIMNKAIAWLGYDAWVIGNHEFDWGWPILATRLSESRVPVLAGNVRARPGTAHPLPMLKPFVIKDVDGVRIAMVGLTTPAIPSWSRPRLLGDLIFESSVESLRRIMPQVKATRPDIIVLLVHQGFRAFGDNHANEINAIARAFPEFDLILGGHSHQPVESVNVHGILYAQAGYYGLWLGRVDLEFDTVSRAVTDKTSMLMPIKGDVPEHEPLYNVLKADLEPIQQTASKEIGIASRSHSAKHQGTGQSDFQQILCEAIAEATQAPIVLHGVFSSEGLNQGPILERDMWRLVPYENTLGVLHLTIAEITEILEDNAQLLQSSQFMGVYGIHYELHTYALPGNRVRNVKLADGSIPHPRTRFRVALNSYVLASGGKRFPAARRLADTPLSRLEWISMETREALRTYISRMSPLDVEANQEAVIRYTSQP